MGAMSTNRQIVLASKPIGLPKESDFRISEVAMPDLKEGELSIKTAYLSVDPYMRGRITGVKSYAEPVLPGDMMVGGAVGRVVNSRNAGFSEGDWVTGYWGWQEYVVSDGKGISKLDPEIAPVTAALGILGMPGMTAYFGFLEICKPKAGETVVVSGAAGAVGSAVGQIAKIHGCHVVGIAGTDDKIKHIIEDLGFDAAFNYKTAGKYATKLKELCPNGIDCYFDNVGGEISDAVFTQMNTFGRVSVCGLISQYNIEKPEPGPRLLPQILVRQLHVEGFIVTRFAGRFAEGYKQMAQWLKQGKLKYREEFMTGFENTPKAFIAMLEGRNTGKMLVDCR
jgi:leukotriene B4 12-hydroxydehydrogenase/15-oxo-prostaglandin 13-reductase